MAESHRISGNYRAVSVVPDSRGGCDAVKAITEQRYLLDEAPMLPLAECNRGGQCKCKYKRWDDRRQEDRRALDHGFSNQFFHDEDSRSNRRGRRSTD